MKQVDILSTIVLLLIAISIFPLESAGQGTTAAPILNLGGGTRAAALGDAFSAINNDVTAALWNPSGLGIMDRRQVALSYVDRAQLFGEAGEGLYYAFFAGALPFGDVGTLGTMLQLEGQGEIDVTTTSPEPIRTENLGTNWVWTVSYADKLAKGLLGGVSGKVISLKLGEASARAYAIDFGLQYDLPSIVASTVAPIRVGAAVQNWGTRIHFIDENQSDPLPRLFRFGTSIILHNRGNHQVRLIGDLTASIDQLRKDEDELRLELSAQISNEQGLIEDQEQEPEFTSEDLANARSERGIGVHALEWRHMQKSVGLEYWLGSFLALRVGYKEEPGINLLNFTDHLTYGLGVRLLNYQLDFAQLPGGGPEQKRLNVFALILQF